MTDEHKAELEEGLRPQVDLASAALQLEEERRVRVSELAVKLKGRLEAAVGQFAGVTPYGEMKVTSERQMEVLFRVQDAHRWLQDLDGLLKEEDYLGERAGFRLHVCKLYLRHEGALKHLWHMAVQVRGLVTLEGAVDHLDLVIRSIASRPGPRAPVRRAKLPEKRQVERSPDGKTTVETVPLIASGRRRNEPSAPLLNKGSKGAHLIRIGS